MNALRRPTRLDSRLATATAAATLALCLMPRPVGAVVPTAGGPVGATSYSINASTAVARANFKLK